MYSPRILFSLMTTYNSLILWQNLSLAWNSTNSLAWLARECQELLSHLHLVIILITNTFHSAWPFKCGFWNSYLNACNGIILLSKLSSPAQIYRSLLEHDVMVTQLPSFLNIYCEPSKYQTLNTEDGVVVSPTLPDPSSSSSPLSPNQPVFTISQKQRNPMFLYLEKNEKGWATKKDGKVNEYEGCAITHACKWVREIFPKWEKLLDW